MVFCKQLEFTREEVALVEAAWQIARSEASLTQEVIRSGIVQSIQRGRQIEAKAAPRPLSASSKTLPAPKIRPVVTAAMYSVQDELVLGQVQGRSGQGRAGLLGKTMRMFQKPWQL